MRNFTTSLIIRTVAIMVLLMTPFTSVAVIPSCQVVKSADDDNLYTGDYFGFQIHFRVISETEVSVAKVSDAGNTDGLCGFPWTISFITDDNRNIGYDVTAIEADALAGLTGVSQIGLTNMIKTVGANALNLPQLEHVWYYSASPLISDNASTRLSHDAFGDAETSEYIFSNCTLHIVSTLYDMISQADVWSSFIDIESFIDTSNVEFTTSGNGYVSIFTIDGIQIPADTERSRLPAGIYIRKDSNGDTRKFIVR